VRQARCSSSPSSPPSPCARPLGTPLTRPPQSLALAEGEHTSKQHFQERKQMISAQLKGRQGERKLADVNTWYIDEDSDVKCPNDDNCFTPSFPRGPSICTNAGGVITSDIDGNIKSPFVIPPECLPSPKTTKQECTAINALWNNKFTFCCPLWMNGDDYWGDSTTSVLPQYKIDDPAVLSTFFHRQNSDFLDYIGYPNLAATKWVGKGNKGGCRLFLGASPPLAID
jgi:hypothetical protein